MIGLFVPGNPVTADENYIQIWNFKESYHGIADERGFYFKTTCLVNSFRYEEMPADPRVIIGQDLKKSGDTKSVVVRCGSIGMVGYFAGPRHHIVDQLALSDPLLSRLPARDSTNWRIGHIVRDIPDGYVQSIETNSNLITDPSISEFYEVLRLITQGPLFDHARLRAIWDINTL